MGLSSLRVTLQRWELIDVGHDRSDRPCDSHVVAALDKPLTFRKQMQQ
jgi:hypothetical protein